MPTKNKIKPYSELTEEEILEMVRPDFSKANIEISRIDRNDMGLCIFVKSRNVLLMRKAYNELKKNEVFKRVAISIMPSNEERINRTMEKEITKTAYLLGVVDIDTIPPKLIGAEVYSEKYPTLGKKWTFVILEATGSNYEAAMRKLAAMVESSPVHQWCKPYTKHIGSENIETD